MLRAEKLGRIKGLIAAKRPGLLANLHPSFIVAAATVFAGKPAPTQIGVDTHRGLGACRRVGAGLPAKGPGLLANLHQSYSVAAATVFAGKPAPTTVRANG
ncbi:hypothetical protein PRJ_3014 [Pseudomonas sp. XWY-1]|nr:hypothetical protein PRJ_3014 [Pseudomonas sp. XWY-1]QNV67820.1 hypothetical protein F7661_19590 [Pseudomonas sp. CFA]